MQPEIETRDKPWEKLHETLDEGDGARLKAFLDELGPAETARAISRLAKEDQSRVLMLLEPAQAADLLEDVPEAQAADLIEELPVEQAAAIVDEMQSDHQADLLGVLEEERLEAILDQMSPEEASDVRRLLGYPEDSAGGLMVTEFLTYRQEQRISEVLEDLRVNRDHYAEYDVQYLYVTDENDRLVGVLRIRDLLFTERTATLSSIMIRNPLRLTTEADLRVLDDFFEQHHLFGVPVVDGEDRLMGVLQPEAVEEAQRRRSDRRFLGVSGIVGGEEFRTMPLHVRSGRRLSWLTINIFLNIAAASVIAVYQDTLAAVIAIAVFLPMISDMSGCAGNQAVAVSLRELALGLVRPREHLRVLAKEASLGIVNGLALGLLLGAVAVLWKGNPYLGLVVGGALALNTVVAVSLGGLLPLLLKRIKVDPALVSGPLLTTVTDMCGFFFVLSFATALLPLLTGR
jgi:magnesium transporter